MPRTRGKKGAKASPKKAAAAATVEDETVETPVEAQTEEQAVTETVMECEDVPAIIEPTVEATDPGPKVEEAETSVNGNDEQPAASSAQVENMDTGDQEKKMDTSVEEPKEPVYQPHSIPGFTNKSVVEKWEWHIRVFPIDQADIRSCVLDSVTKIAQESWMYIDNQNYGMGAYDLCIKNASDAATIVLKTLAMPMTYRYVTVDVTRRAKNAADVKKLTQKKSSMGEDETDLDDAIDELPFSDIAEKATLLLDYTQTYVLTKVKGQEKKRNLYVKYLPDSTSKELLKVLFPVANNLDIIKTAKGRRVGELNVSSIPNILGICNSYVATHINGRKNITLDWNEENIEDNRLVQESHDEIPWEIIPRDIEYPYETVPYIETDDLNEYGRKRLKEENLRQDRGRDRDGDRRRQDRMRDVRPAVGDVLRMQHEMNERISSQVALLAAVGDAASVPPPLMGIPPGAYPGGPVGPMMPMGPPFRREKRERGKRGGRQVKARRAAMLGLTPDDQNRDKDKDKDDKKKTDKEKEDGSKDDASGEGGAGKTGDKSERRFGRDGRSPQGPRHDGGNRFGGQSRWESEGRFGGRFDDQRGGFGNRGSRFDDRRGGGDGRAGGPFGGPGGMRGSRFDDFGRGGGGRFGDRGGRGGIFEGDGRPGMMGAAPPMEDMGRRGGRMGGGFGNAGNRGNMRNQGMGDNQGFGDMRRMQNQQGGFGNRMGGSGGSGSGGGGFGNKQFGGFMNQGRNQTGTGGNYGGQSGGFGNQSSGGGYSNMQDQSSGYGNQNQMSSYSTQQSGTTDNQQGGFNNMSMQGSGFGNQSKQSGGGFGNQAGSNNYVYSTGMNQQSSFTGNQNNTANTSGNQSSQKSQTGFGNKNQTGSAQRGFGNQTGMNRQNTSSGSNQSGMGMQKQQAAAVSKSQTGMGSMGNQTQQQDVGMSQGTYGSQQSGFNNQQGTYGTQNYGNYGTDNSSYQQNYMNQQQQQQMYAGYNTTTDTSGGAWSAPQGDYSQYSSQQQTQGTTPTANYSTTSNIGQTDSYSTSSYNTQGAGYSADAAFANQGFYAAPQNTGNGAYGEYDTSTAAYSTGSSNMSNMATYNFPSYNTGS